MLPLHMRFVIRRNPNYLKGLGLGLFFAVYFFFFFGYKLVLAPAAMVLGKILTAPFTLLWAIIQGTWGVIQGTGIALSYALFGYIDMMGIDEQRAALEKMEALLKDELAKLQAK